MFKFGSVSVKDIRKYVLILQVGGSSHVTPTPPVVRVVLLHKRAGVQSFLSTTICTNLLFQYKVSFLLHLTYSYVLLAITYLTRKFHGALTNFHGSVKQNSRNISETNIIQSMYVHIHILCKYLSSRIEYDFRYLNK